MNCPVAELSRLEYAPHRVRLFYDQQLDELLPTGDNELLDDSWKETDSFWCHTCDTELEGVEEALEHVGWR